MRIVVNDIAASSGGALTVLKSFYNYIIENDDENEWIFLLSKMYVKETKNVKVILLEKVKKNWINRLTFDIISGKKIITSLKPDIVFSLQNTITFGLKVPQIVYMHQSLPFQREKKFSFFNSKERTLAVYQYIIGFLIKKSIKKADKIIVQTEWIKKSVIETTKINSNKIIKISPNEEDYSSFKNSDIFNKNTFFYPAAEHIYKNHECIYRACEILNNKGLQDFIVQLTLPQKEKRKNILNIGEQKFESVMNKYNTSTLIFPSYIETVGLPLLEARQMNTIILASDCSFSREVLANYENAYYFNPFEPEELASLMEKVIKNKIKKKRIQKETSIMSDSWNEVKEVILEFA